jgi:spermidine/putrescine transport system permease protein
MTAAFSVLARAYIALVLVFLYLPVVVLCVMSFNDSQLYALPISWSVRWYQELMNNDKLVLASEHSLLLALANTVVATTLGTIAALGLARYDFKGKAILQALLLPPIAIPWLILGTSMLVLFFWIGIGRGLHSLLLGHVALSLPYVIVVVGARLTNHGTLLEEAAATLGAGPFVAFRRVTFPLIAPGIIAAALFAFAVSLDQFVISYFLASPGFQTLPVEIYTAIRKGFTPEINAIATMLIVLSSAIFMIVARFYRFGGER